MSARLRGAQAVAPAAHGAGGGDRDRWAVPDRLGAVEERLAGLLEQLDLQGAELAELPDLHAGLLEQLEAIIMIIFIMIIIIITKIHLLLLLTIITVIIIIIIIIIIRRSWPAATT